MATLIMVELTAQTSVYVKNFSAFIVLKNAQLDRIDAAVCSYFYISYPVLFALLAMNR